jgi:TolA-binding protein
VTGRLFAVIALALLPLAAGAAKPPPPQPTLKDLKRDAPEVRTDEAIAPDPERAKQLYRDFLDLEGGDPALRTEAMRRLGDLQMEAGDGARGEGVGQGEAETREAIAIYTRLLEQEPDYPRADVVLYQLARGCESLGDANKALGYLDALVAKYPSSQRIDEAQFRRGEILFSAKRYPEAQNAYEAASGYGATSQFYEQSLYKLGWSLFKQSENQASFEPFARVLDLKLVDPAKPAALLDTAELPRADRELVQDTFRVLSIGFSYENGQETLDRFVSRRGEMPYTHLLYSELGDLYVSKERYTDAADTYRAFVERNPDHEHAPLLQMQAIEAYRKGGFAQLVLDGKKEFVEHYRLGSSFWAQRTPEEFPLVAKELKTNLTDLAQYYRAEAQRSKKKSDFYEAARWYREFLQSFPDDPESAETNYLLADTLFESEDFRAAAVEYERTAYAYPFHAKSAEAGYAALVSYEREGKAMEGESAAAWNRQRLESQQRFAVTFPAHSESATLLTRTAREYYDLKDLPKALEVAGLVLARQPSVPMDMQRTAWTVTGNAQFDTGAFADAEGAYLQVQSLMAPGDAEAAAINERLAAAIYKQGDAKKAAGDVGGAIDAFLRVGKLAPGSSIRETADFDAGALLVSLKDCRAPSRCWSPTAPPTRATHARQTSHATSHSPISKAGGRGMPRANSSASPSRPGRRRTCSKAPFGRRPSFTRSRIRNRVQCRPMSATCSVSRRQCRRPSSAAQARRLRTRDRRRHRPAQWLDSIVAADRDAGGRAPIAAAISPALATLELTSASAIPSRRSRWSRRSSSRSSTRSGDGARTCGLSGRHILLGRRGDDRGNLRNGRALPSTGADLMKSERPANLDADALEQYDILLGEQAFPSRKGGRGHRPECASRRQTASTTTG